MLYSYYASFAARDCEIRIWGLGGTWAGSNFDRGLHWEENLLPNVSLASVTPSDFTCMGGQSETEVLATTIDSTYVVFQRQLQLISKFHETVDRCNYDKLISAHAAAIYRASF